MKLRIYILNLLFLCISFVCLKLVNCRSYNNGLIFYDLQTLQPYLPPTVSVSRGRGLASVKFSEKGSIWSTFGKPCECHHKVCGCCAGINVKQYNFNQKLCANVTFIPPSEEALLEVYLNGVPSSKYGLSVRNPSPFCIPIMMGIPMAMCVQMSDIAIKGNNLNMCMDFIVRLATTDLFEMHFQCMQMGLDGFQYLDKDGNPVIPPGSSKTQIDNDYYDYDGDADAENEISSNNADEEDAYDEVEAQQQPTITVDGSYIVGLQQQMEQLKVKDAEQNRIEHHNLVTQINDKASTMPATIVVDAQTEVIAAITTAYGNADGGAAAGPDGIQAMATKAVDFTTAEPEATESETEANNSNSAASAEDQTESETEFQTEIGSPATTTKSSVNNDSPDDNYAEPTATAPAPAVTTTTEDAFNNPTTTTNINGLTDTMENEDDIDMNIHAEPLQNVAANYESDAFNATDSNIYSGSTLAAPTTVLADEAAAAETTTTTTLNPIAGSYTTSTSVERSTFSRISATDSSAAPATGRPVGTSCRHLDG